MEDIENQSTGIAGRIISFIKGTPESSGDASDVDGQRQDSVSGTGEKEEVIYEVVPQSAIDDFPVKLVDPAGDIFTPYGIAAEAFQRDVIALNDPHINWLTITQMTVPSIDAPDTHITPYCGFPVIKGDKFSVRLSNGMLINA